MDKEKVMVTFAVDSPLYERIKDYRFEKRIDSISEALRILIEKALEAEKPPTVTPRKRNNRSQSIVASPAWGFPPVCGSRKDAGVEF